jgi:hypothetical protein
VTDRVALPRLVKVADPEASPESVIVGSEVAVVAIVTSPKSVSVPAPVTAPLKVTVGLKSCAATARNTDAFPERFIALSELLLSVTDRERVVPLDVYVPVPISKLLLAPSSRTYLTVSPLDTPASAKD